jgi:hypothetical protein
MPKSSAKVPAKGLTLKKMMDNSLRDAIPKAKEDQLLSVTKMVSRKGRVALKARVQRLARKRGEKPEKHTCWIIGLEDEGPVSKQRCMVSCDCEAFKFMWEYALTHYGASKIKYCNGMPPHITNPHLAPGICHHLTALAIHARKQGL